jgi:hypothetical protein
MQRQYDSVVSCTNALDEALSNMSVANMPHGAEIVQTMRDSFRQQVKSAAGPVRDALKLAGALDASQPAMMAIQNLQKGGLCR